MSRLKPCPFCGSNNIDYSVKTCGSRRKQYHVAMYCKECNCYGKRTLIKLTEEEYRRYEVENNKEYKELAIQAWNTRKPIDKVVEQLGKRYKDCQNGIFKYHEQGNQEMVEICFNRGDAYIDAIEIVKEGGIDGRN